MKRFVVLLTLALVPAQAWAITWQVWPGQSIQTAINGARAGDVVIVHAEGQRSATYYESLTLKAGVTVRSDGYAEVTIDGQNASQTISLTGNGQGMFFGGPGVGFTISGGTTYGVWFPGVSNLTVQELKVISDPSLSAMVVSGDGATTHLIDIFIRDQTTAVFGLDLGGDFTVQGLRVQNVATTAVHAEWCAPTLQAPYLRYCDVGCLVTAGTIAIDGGMIEYCGTGAGASANSWPAQVVANGVDFVNCDIGISACGDGYGHPGIVTATGCTVRECDIGINSQRGAGSIKGCGFELNDTGIVVTDALSTLYIGGDGADMNHFWTSPGDGIHLGAGAKASIGANTFEGVAGTAIHVESGNGNVSISGCEMAGSGGFQGIRTRGQGTMATIRNCTIQGYSSAVVPLPRAVAVTDLFMTGPTADLGTVAPNSPGTNAFSQNTTDLFYGPSIGQPGQNPVPIYAQLNYWGENPPAAQSFGGSWAGAIVYDPWLPQPPAPAPRLPEDDALPTGLVVEAARPNPAHETTTIALSLPASGHAEVAVFDMQGRLMKTLLNEERPSGRVMVEWDGTDETGRRLGAGIYLWKVRSVSGTAAGTLVLIR